MIKKMQEVVDYLKLLKGAGVDTDYDVLSVMTIGTSRADIMLNEKVFRELYGKSSDVHEEYCFCDKENIQYNYMRLSVNITEYVQVFCVVSQV